MFILGRRFTGNVLVHWLVLKGSVFVNKYTQLRELYDSSAKENKIYSYNEKL